MSGKLFAEIPYAPPEIEEAEIRIGNDGQAVSILSMHDARLQASRCVSCDIPGCNTGCPVNQNIPGFLQAIERDQWLQAHQIAVQNSPLYGLFGTVCPQQQGLCESNCTVALVSPLNERIQGKLQAPLEDTLTIGAVEAAIWKHAIEQQWLRYPTPTKETGKKVFVVGAGPAGIYAAIGLRTKGHAVTIIDAQDEVGGLLLRGIPPFKMAKETLPNVRQAMEASGIKFELGVRVGVNGKYTLSELRERSNAVLLSIGTQQARTILHPDTGLPIDGHQHMVSALDFLYSHGDAARAGMALPPEHDIAGKRVLIIGAGDTSMDAVGTSVRNSGASELHLMIRSTIRASYKDMTARMEEAGTALEGGAQRIMGEPLSIHEASAVGRNAFTIMYRKANGGIGGFDVDLPLNAAGFAKANLSEIFGMDIQRDESPFRRGFTNIDGVFVAGDAGVQGATLAVTAAREGRDVAHIINQRLRALVPV